MMAKRPLAIYPQTHQTSMKLTPVTPPKNQAFSSGSSKKESSKDIRKLFAKCTKIDRDKKLLKMNNQSIDQILCISTKFVWIFAPAR